MTPQQFQANLVDLVQAAAKSRRGRSKDFAADKKNSRCAQVLGKLAAKLAAMSLNNALLVGLHATWQEAEQMQWTEQFAGTRRGFTFRYGLREESDDPKAYLAALANALLDQQLLQHATQKAQHNDEKQRQDAAEKQQHRTATRRVAEDEMDHGAALDSDLDSLRGIGLPSSRHSY